MAFVRGQVGAILLEIVAVARQGTFRIWKTAFPSWILPVLTPVGYKKTSIPGYAKKKQIHVDLHANLCQISWESPMESP